jgi:thioester reductase-like protein/predicted lipid carrier protein YhbT
MPANGSIFLTGATGFLGRYLLRDLLLGGHQVAVLVRDSRSASATERIAELLAFWSETLGRTLPSPIVLNGALDSANLGLSFADRAWLGRSGATVLHAAANLSFRPSAAGEPWKTNVEGTQALVKLCRELGLSRWHHVSTAFVCGRCQGTIHEEDLACGQDFHNPYEQSKFEAEQLLRRTGGLAVTVHRPAVIVGDSQTGYTSTFAGFYGFLELGARLAEATARPGAPRTQPRLLPLRLPLDGTQACNLVPVDWVSRAVVELLGQSRWQGRTFHLVSRQPLSLRDILSVALEELNVTGIELAGAQGLRDPSRLEQFFLESLPEYWPYLGGAPTFACSNTLAALPHFPAPRVDRPLLQRLIRFAIARDWGRSASEGNAVPLACASGLCANYLETIFPQQARKSRLAQEIGLHLTVAFDLRGEGGGQWSCNWRHGELTSMSPGLDDRAEVIYHTDTTTFEAIISGRLAPQQAFFDERITLTGDLETALKLMVLFNQFLRETAAAGSPLLEARNAAGFGQPASGRC